MEPENNEGGGTPPADNNQQQQPPQGGESQPPQGDNTPEFNIPEAYQRRETDEGKVENAWVDKVKSVDDLWKLAANSQHALGKKHAIPDFESATPQEIENYFNEVRPASADEYNFKTSEDYKETGLEGDFGNMLHSIGISKYQGDKLIQAYQELEKSKAAELYDADKFVGMMEESFGKGYESKVDTTRQLIEANLNEQQREALDDVPNQYLKLIYELADNMNKAYGANESGAGGNTNPGAGVVKDYAKMQAEKREEIRKLSNQPHTVEQKQKLINELHALKNEEIKRRQR